jgi:hypothetical protein
MSPDLSPQVVMAVAVVVVVVMVVVVNFQNQQFKKIVCDIIFTFADVHTGFWCLLARCKWRG